MTVICSCGRVMQKCDKNRFPDGYMCNHCDCAVHIIMDSPAKDAAICPICHEPT